MKSALFVNFTLNSFTGHWDGKPQTFAPGQKVSMPEYLARHFAKHLANKVLLESKNVNNESYTSPKNPEQVPAFMELFNKACIVADEPDQTPLDVEIATMNPEGTGMHSELEIKKDVQIAEFPDDEEPSTEPVPLKRGPGRPKKE